MTCPNTLRSHAPGPLRILVLAAALSAAAPSGASLSFGNNPLYLVGGKANVLITLDNSNSMDEDASGTAVGSNTATSKSEVARGVIRGLTSTYLNRVNMGLMAYRQNSPSASNLHSSPYDVSYDPSHYVPGWTGDRASATNKRFRVPNPTSAGNYVHFNVALPFYSGSNEGNAFCYSPTANAFNNGENPTSGPWDSYRCFRSKAGTSNTLPTWNNAASETAQGYATAVGTYTFNPTDSDFAQGILDFGKQMTWTYVGRTWSRNDSPGRGYLHVPLGNLTAAQGTAIRNKLACNVPGNPAPCTTAGIPNAGLTPIEGTLLTAKDYFGGSWSNSGEGYTSGCYPLPESCGKNFVVLLTDGLPSNDKNGAIVSNPATALAAAAAAAATLKAAGIETYVIGFALPYGTNPRSLDTVAISGGTDKAYDASDSASLQAAFNAIFDDIFKKTSSFGSISQNSTAINTGSRIYQGRFDSTDWSGELVAMRPETDGTLTPLWSTSDSGHFTAAATRKVFTYKPAVGGVAFKLLADLTTAQQDQLRLPNCSAGLTGDPCGQARIDWLRGDKSYEPTASGPLRGRARVLGDIISSSPYYATETNTLFVGSNDGMLHAFDAATGNEIFAYLPNAVMSGVYKLTDPAYSHQYYVDGELAISTKYDTPGKNILVGALGRGGKALYALDVSNPSTFGAAQVLWEFTDADLGLALGKPFITRLNNGKAAVIVGNGYNSTNERAVLFVIDLETGALIRKIDTQAGSASASNGLATPRGWDADGSGTVDMVYAGDRLGNVWKFDLRNSSASAWGSAFNTSGVPDPMFVARDSAGNRQPITGGIALGLNSRQGDANFGKVYVFFGTGQYLLSTDVSDKSVQSWYGLIDDEATISGRSVLKQRTIATEGTVGTTAVRSFSLPVAGDMAGKKGWYVDWLPPSNVAGGERVITDSKFFGSVLLVTSITPTTNVCIPGGTGYLNAIDPFSGANLASPFFNVGTSASGTPAGSVSPNNNLPSEAILIGNFVISSGTSGEVRSVSAKNPIRTGRIAWREIVRP